MSDVCKICGPTAISAVISLESDEQHRGLFPHVCMVWFRYSLDWWRMGTFPRVGINGRQDSISSRSSGGHSHSLRKCAVGFLCSASWQDTVTSPVSWLDRQAWQMIGCYHTDGHKRCIVESYRWFSARGFEYLYIHRIDQNIYQSNNIICSSLASDDVCAAKQPCFTLGIIR